MAQQLGFAATQLVLLWAMSTWRPRFRFSSAHARDLLGFSSGVFLSNLGGFLNRRADALLMGIFFGPVAVGLYRLADRFSDNVLELTMRPVGHVALPFFSRLQNDRPALNDAVASSIRTTLILTVPAMAVMAACSDFLMALMGPEWEPAADVLKLLALVGIGKAIVFFTGPLLFAVARPHLRAVMLWALAALSAGTVLLVGLAADGRGKPGAGSRHGRLSGGALPGDRHPRQPRRRLLDHRPAASLLPSLASFPARSRPPPGSASSPCSSSRGSWTGCPPSPRS